MRSPSTPRAECARLPCPPVAVGGAVRLAAAAGVPLVPCSVWGTQRLLTRGRRLPDLRGGVDVHVRFGASVDVSGPVVAVTRTLMAHIADLTRATLAATAGSTDVGLNAGSPFLPSTGEGAQRVAA